MARLNKDHIGMFYEHGLEISTRTVYMGHGENSSEDVDEKTTASLLKSLHVLSSIRPEDPIRILINNRGGDVQYGLAIYDMIRSMRSPVNVCIYGYCNSIAAWITQAADWRQMSHNSQMMIHDGEATLSGSNKAVANWYKFQKEQNNRCYQILLKRIQEKHPEFTLIRLKKLLEIDNILWAHQALDLGLIDEIV